MKVDLTFWEEDEERYVVITIVGNAEVIQRIIRLLQDAGLKLK